MNFFKKRNNVIGLILILIGFLAILNKFFDIKINFSWGEIWPFLLILWGVIILWKK